MVNVFTSNITEGIDEIAPVKTFTVKTHHKFGLSDATKKLCQRETIAGLKWRMPHPMIGRSYTPSIRR